jgi:phosphoketolase
VTELRVSTRSIRIIRIYEELIRTMSIRRKTLAPDQHYGQDMPEIRNWSWSRTG